MADLTQTIIDTAGNPKEAETDGVRAKSQDLSELIAADRYLKSTDSIAAKAIGVRLFKIVPPGTQ